MLQLWFHMFVEKAQGFLFVAILHDAADLNKLFVFQGEDDGLFHDYLSWLPGSSTTARCNSWGKYLRRK